MLISRIHLLCQQGQRSSSALPSLLCQQKRKQQQLASTLIGSGLFLPFFGWLPAIFLIFNTFASALRHAFEGRSTKEYLFRDKRQL